jgi:ABC-2 type transport system ATP-binding protein
VTAIEVEHLVKRFGGFIAVEDVSFTVPAGEVAAVLGPNGAGKTTTIEVLEGFLAPSRGTVRVLGTDPRRGGRRPGAVRRIATHDGAGGDLRLGRDADPLAHGRP